MGDLVVGAASASICLSKGLGAPMGSVLAGPLDFIQTARRYRRMLGGGLRQAGLMAAGGLYALDHHMADLRLDIDRARALAAALSESSTFAPIGHPDSNIVVAETVGWEAEAALAALADRGLRAMAFGVSRVRFVLHRDITDEAFESALAAVRAVRS
jgi:threonine aldolase